MIASSMVTLGLSPWQAWGCVWIGYTLAAPFLVLNARPGAILHVTFPVVARTSFGIWGSLWCVFNRGAMAWYVTPYFSAISTSLWRDSIWYGVQASIGGSCVKVMLRAIWPSVNDIRMEYHPFFSDYVSHVFFVI
jgi:nucleobase:cation symporter-1, NCS1 family